MVPSFNSQFGNTTLPSCIAVLPARGAIHHLMLLELSEVEPDLEIEYLEYMSATGFIHT